MSIPLLFFTSQEGTLEELERASTEKSVSEGPNVLNAWTHGDLITVHMLGLIHVEYSSMYQRNEDVWKGFAEAQQADYSREDGITGFAWVARYTLQFLDAYIKHDSAAITYLKKTPAENGVPRHFMTVNYRPAKGVPASLDAFRVDWPPRLRSRHRRLRRDAEGKSDFKLDETAVNSWAYELLNDNNLPEAIILLKLNVQSYPDSGNSYDSLGEAYMKTGQKQLAIENYKKSLEKDPTNDNAKQKLRDLESSTPGAK